MGWISRLKIILISVVFVLGVVGALVFTSGQPLVHPQYHVGQVLAMRMGGDQCIVMEVRRGTKICTYVCKFYYKNGREELRSYKEFELYIPEKK